MKIGRAQVGYRGNFTICPNYDGWVVIDDSSDISPDFCWYIYKSKRSARNAIRKFLEGSHMAEPQIIRRMTEEEFINALNFD